MHAVVNHLHLNKSVDEIAQAIRNEGLSILAQYPGFLDFSVVKVDDLHGMVIIMWDTADNAENGKEKFGSTWFAQNVTPYLASEMQRVTGEVIVQYNG